MGGAIKGIAKLAGPIMNIASMFTPLGPIMGMVQTAMKFAGTITNALKAVAPKAMEKLDQKLAKAQDWAQKAVGKAQDFLTNVAKGVEGLGNAAQQAQFPPAAPAPAMGFLPFF